MLLYIWYGSVIIHVYQKSIRSLYFFLSLVNRQIIKYKNTFTIKYSLQKEYKSIGFVENVIQPITLPYDTPISMRLDIKEYLSQMALNW